MHKARLVVSGGLILALCAMAGPRATHAEMVAKSGCATGAVMTMLTAPNMSFTGRATNALPVPLTTTVPPAVSIVGTENPPVVIAAPVTVVTSTIVAPMEYGLFNYIAGIKPVVFPNAENEISEFFTFSSTANSLTDMPFGGFSASNRVGTFTVYLGHGDFANAATFSSGTPIMTATYNQQILVPNAAANMATGTNAAGSLSLGVAGVPSVTSTSAGTGAARMRPN